MSTRPDCMTVKADIPKNRLYFAVAGKITKSELDKLYTDVRFCVADLKSPFDVITDLSGCNLGMLSGVPTLRKIMNFLISKNVGSFVRVTKHNSLIYRQAINLASRIQGYKPVYASSIDEAEKILDNCVNRDGLRFCLHEQVVKYIGTGQEQSGTIIDISISGCAVKTAVEPPLEGEDVVLKISLEDTEEASQVLELKAKVIRAEEAFFAVTFIEPGSSYREHLLACLVRESQR